MRLVAFSMLAVVASAFAVGAPSVVADPPAPPLAAATSPAPAAADPTAPAAVVLAPPQEPVPILDVPALVERVQNVLPPTWRVVEADSARQPIGWSGGDRGLYVMVEDSRTRFLHPSGFPYYSFYRVWLMPPTWEGEMRMTAYVSDSAPAYLLGASDGCIAFYHTAGGNVWDDGPGALCAALGLDRICYAAAGGRIVDMAVEERLSTERAAPDSGFAINPRRILGLAGEGRSLYLEYVFPPPEDDGAAHLSDLTARLAREVFSLLPEVESLYLRRCSVDSFTDTIVQRD